MKVLEKGREQKGWAKECYCTGAGNGNGGCHAKLLVEEKDLFVTSNTDFKGETDYYVTFKCSECGHLTDIKGYPKSIYSLPSQKEWNESQSNFM